MTSRSNPYLPLAVAAGLLAVTGCGAVEKQDAHRSTVIDRNPAAVLAMPDSFSNVASKCDGHGHRVYVTSHGDVNRPSMMVVVSDETCR